MQKKAQGSDIMQFAAAMGMSVKK